MDLEHIVTVASEVTAETQELLSAIESEERAAGDLLDRLAAKARPIVALLGKRQCDHWAETGGRDGCHPVSETTRNGPVGVTLIDDYRKPGNAQGDGGRYVGCRLLLTHDGFVEGERDGTWSKWQGAWDQYEATFRPMTGVEVATEYEADDVIKAICAAVEKAASEKPDASTHRKRAEKFAALAALL